mgnify:CR=1 FL=1
MIKYNAPDNKKEYEQIRKNWNKTYNNPNRPYQEINTTGYENNYYKPQKKNKGIGCIIALLVAILFILLIPYLITTGALIALSELANTL